MENDNTTTKPETINKIGAMDKFFGSTGLAFHRSLIFARDYVSEHPVVGTLAYAPAASWAAVSAPFRGFFDRKSYEEYAAAEKANPDKRVDFDTVTNKPYIVPEKQKTPAQMPDTNSLFMAGLTATAICVAAIIKAVDSRNRA